MKDIKITLHRQFLTKRIGCFVLLLLLHIGPVCSSEIKNQTSFDEVVMAVQKERYAQHTSHSNRGFYEMPLHDGERSVYIGANAFMKLVNPYPSSIDVNRFLEENMRLIAGSLYVLVVENAWSDPSFSVQNLVMEVATVSKCSFERMRKMKKKARNKITKGQSFYVMGKGQSGFVRFSNSQRIRQLKNIHQGIPMLKIGLDYTSLQGVKMHRQLGLSFKKGNTSHYESGYDSALVDLHTHENDMYWDFGDGRKYVIAGVGALKGGIEIPLVLQIMNEEGILLSLDVKENIQHVVYLHDRLTDEKWAFTATGVSLDLAKGTYEDRFYIGVAVKEDSAEMH